MWMMKVFTLRRFSTQVFEMATPIAENYNQRIAHKKSQIVDTTCQEPEEEAEPERGSNAWIVGWLGKKLSSAEINMEVNNLKQLVKHKRKEAPPNNGIPQTSLSKFVGAPLGSTGGIKKFIQNKLDSCEQMAPAGTAANMAGGQSKMMHLFRITPVALYEEECMELFNMQYNFITNHLLGTEEVPDIFKLWVSLPFRKGGLGIRCRSADAAAAWLSSFIITIPQLLQVELFPWSAAALKLPQNNFAKALFEKIKKLYMDELLPI